MRHRTHFLLPLLLSLAVFIGAAVWISLRVEDAGELARREGLRQAELAVRRAAVSCYALDGAYPATYADLKERSGQAVDEGEYQVFYEIFASNLMPEITVVRRGGKLP